MSLKAEETLRESIDELWSEVIVPHIFASGDDVSTALGSGSQPQAIRQTAIPPGEHINILNKSLSHMKANFYAFLTMHHESTIDDVIMNENIVDEDSDEMSTGEVD